MSGSDSLGVYLAHGHCPGALTACPPSPARLVRHQQAAIIAGRPPRAPRVAPASHYRSVNTDDDVVGLDERVRTLPFFQLQPLR